MGIVGGGVCEGRGVNSLSEASVWAVGRSVTAGDLEMLLQSPTKKENRDNKALIPPSLDDSPHLTEQIIQTGDRAEVGPGCRGLGG